MGYALARGREPSFNPSIRFQKMAPNKSDPPLYGSPIIETKLREPAFEIVVHPTRLIELTNRLVRFENATWSLLVSKAGMAINVESHTEFLRYAVEHQDTPVRIYSVDGLRTRIVVPEDYAQKLEAVRKFRLGLEGLARDDTQEIDPNLLNRALPEDFIPHLDALPNTGFVSELFLLNDANPMDPLHQQQSGDPLFESQASAFNNSTITFYKKNVDECIEDELRHEWSHLARWQMPLESTGFDLACKHEGKSYSPRERANLDADERWAVLFGEEMLNPNARNFLELTEKVPLQSVFLARGLTRAIEEAGFADTAWDFRNFRLSHESADISVFLISS